MHGSFCKVRQQNCSKSRISSLCSAHRRQYLQAFFFSFPHTSRYGSSSRLYFLSVLPRMRFYPSSKGKTLGGGSGVSIGLPYHLICRRPRTSTVKMPCRSSKGKQRRSEKRTYRNRPRYLIRRRGISESFPVCRQALISIRKTNSTVCSRNRPLFRRYITTISDRSR